MNERLVQNLLLKICSKTQPSNVSQLLLSAPPISSTLTLILSFDTVHP